jgi:hypothetical protein
MPNLTSIAFTSGAQTATGTVSTVDALMADGGQATMGAIADAAVTAGATGSVSAKLRSISRDVGTVANKLAYTSSVSFTCGTTAYATSDCVGASGANAALDLGVVGQSGGQILITSVELEIDATALIASESSYNLYLYNVTPPSAINDSSPFTLGATDRSAFLGKISFPTPAVEGVTTASLYCYLDGVNKHVQLAGTHLFAYLTSLGGYTPTARVFKITIHTTDL